MNANHPDTLSINYLIRIFTFCSLVAPLLSVPLTASSQESQGIEEFIVTAQRREQNLQEVPISISAFTNDAIVKNMFADVTDFLALTPNASFITSGAKSRRQLSIRGVTSLGGSGLSARSSTLAFYVDGFNVAASSINPPLMDAERIEVLRGPQATYFGRNALGGGINLVTNRPDDELSGSVMLDFARYDTLDVEGVLNLPLIDDVLAVRANVKYYESDGNIENIHPIAGGNDAEYKYAKLAVRYTPTDKLTIDLTGTTASEHVGMREGVPSGVFSTFAGGTLFAGEFPDRDGDGNSDPDIDGIGFFPTNTHLTNFNHPQDIGSEFDYFVAQIDYEMTNHLFTSITGYIDSDFFLNGDIDGGSKDYFNEFRNIDRQSVSQEFRLQNTDDSRLQWSLGVIVAEDKGDIINRTFIGAEMRFGLPDGFLIDGEDSAETAESWAVFGQADYDLTDKLTVSFGGRYTEETIESFIEGFSGTLVTILSVKDTFSDFLPRFAVTYAFDEKTTVYGTASKGYKSGGVQIAPFPGAESFDPETLWNYEIGLKADLLNNKLRLNTALFYMDWEDLQVGFQQAGTNEAGEFFLFGGIDNAEQATSKGVEVSAMALLGENLTVNFGVGYLDAKYDRFVAFIDGENRVLDGRTIPNSPKWTASADAEYGFNVSSSFDGYVRLTWSYRDEIRASNSALIQSGFPWEVPSYNVFNLRVGLEHQNYTIVAYVENLFDKVYYTNAYQKAFAGGLFIEPSFQNYGVRMTYNFDKN